MKKEKHLRIRISAAQMRQLIKTVKSHHLKSKSELVRQAIKDKLDKIKQGENKEA